MSKSRSGGRGSSSRSISQKAKFGKPGSGSDRDKKKSSSKSADKYIRKDSDEEFSNDKKFARKLGGRNHSGVKRDFKSFDSKDKFKRKDDKFSTYDKTSGDRDKKFSKEDKPFFKKKFGEDNDKPRFKKEEGSFERKKFGSESKFSYKKHSDDKFKKKFGDNDRKPTFKKEEGAFAKNKFGGDKFEKKFTDASKDFSKSWAGKKSFSEDDSESKSFRKKDSFKHKDKFGEKRAYKMADAKIESPLDFNLKDHEKSKKSFEKGKNDYNRLLKKSEKNIGKKDLPDSDGSMRLNRYIANSGVCSRRDADNLILAGAVTINGKVVTVLGTKVKPGDKVQYGGQTIKSEKNVYILLNKPKDYITTMDDPQGRKTVMGLLRGACKERVYPVGRLDRNTTGVILFTNDGDLTRRLTHPKFLVSKMYHVSLDQNFTREDLIKMRNGFELEDGFIKPDQIEFNGDEKRELGIEVHSGRNRIVRRMFEHFGYNVVRLDRVMFAGLSKKDTPRGKWRMLTEKEVGFLKML